MATSRADHPRGRRAAVGTGTRPAAILLTHIHPDHPGDLPLASGRYLPEYGNPLDRWLIVPLLRLMPRRRFEASLSRNSLVGTARAFDPGAGVPPCRAGSVSPRRVTRPATSRSSAAATGC
jgi:glyoxylase-like metal-dependent hydrolase (beta-lactamase superfamily II)